MQGDNHSNVRFYAVYCVLHMHHASHLHMDKGPLADLLADTACHMSTRGDSKGMGNARRLRGSSLAWG